MNSQSRLLTFSVDDADADAGVVVAVDGELDLVSTQEFEETISDILRSRAPKTLVLDLSGLCFIDSTGLRVLWSIRQSAQDGSCSLVLRTPSEAVMRLLRLTGMHRVFWIEEDAQARRAKSATAT